MVSQRVVNVKRVEECLREADAMMKALTKSHVAYQFVRDGSSSSEENMRWLCAIQDRHDAAKHLAKDKLEKMGALNQVEQAGGRDLVQGAGLI